MLGAGSALTAADTPADCALAAAARSRIARQQLNRLFTLEPYRTIELLGRFGVDNSYGTLVSWLCENGHKEHFVE